MTVPDGFTKKTRILLLSCIIANLSCVEAETKRCEEVFVVLNHTENKNDFPSLCPSVELATLK